MASGLPPPLSSTEFLDEMGTELPGLYLLGSFNRHITVHSQQRRAINLIQALKASVGLDGKSVAIVGAGFAGLTAAAFAIEETTAQVTLFDVAPRPLWLQDRCANRWLHPGIYDWPLPGSLEPCTALPVLNWRAGTASDVARQVRAEWARVAATNRARLELRLETRATAVARRPEDGRLLVDLFGGEQALFDVVVLAVGFGLERGGLGRVAYWNDADGLDGIAKGSSVLISGLGDGGLADVLRLCLPDVRQDSLIELVRLVPPDNQRRLIEAEEHHLNNGEALDDFYAELRFEEIVRYIKGAAPPVARVTLVGNGHLYGTRSAILNRFLVSQLRQARGEEAFELVKGRVDESSLVELPSGGRRIRFVESGEEREFDHLVLRFGPEAAYRGIAPLADWEAGKVKRRFWYELPQSLDRTRVPLKGVEREAQASREERRDDFLAYESSSRRWCLVLHPPDAPSDLAGHTRLALEEIRSTENLNVHPLALSSKEAVGNQAALCSAVRALCAADIVIADVTGYDPSLLLLLGIRAAVRRGITIACTQDSLTPKAVEELPFNLKELNLVSFHDEDDGYKELQSTLRAGLDQSSASNRYLDLPVYDYIREEPTDKAKADDPQRVLILRPFRLYTSLRKNFVEKHIRERLGLSDDARVEAVIDQASPRIAGQRLYEAIRHWRTCVVDLTWWRPNVMFELGVRLAARPSGTFCLIDKSVDGSATFDGVRAHLKELLHPFIYDLKTFFFSERFPSPDPGQNPIYETAARHFRTAQDHYDERVDAILSAAAALTPGHDDPLQDVDITPLYAGHNRNYGEVIRHSVFERLCAAWYYLADREAPHAVRPIELLDPRRAEAFDRFTKLGSRLKAKLAQRYEPRDKHLRQRIENAEKCARDSGAKAMADLLEKWRTLQKDPPWRIDPAQVEAADVVDWEEQIGQLKELEARLKDLDNLVCELPLQGVRSDRQRVETVLQKLKGRTP